MKRESSYASSAETENESLSADHQKEVAKVAVKETAKALLDMDAIDGMEEDWEEDTYSLPSEGWLDKKTIEREKYFGQSTAMNTSKILVRVVGAAMETARAYVVA